MTKQINRQVNFKIAIFRMLMPIIALVSISGCSTYPNKFKCGDARGLGCTMLHEVDKQIDSGQIAEVYARKKCRGKKCLSKPIDDGLILRKRDKAKAYEDQQDENIADDNSLNF